jgi:serine/threonine-protein kinase
MSLTPGTKLGTFEITRSLGKGGMGEVYLAKDSKLGREVAIKVLPDALASDEDRLSRFQQEAQTLATLNHSNIATVHGFEHDAEQDTHYLIMEYIDGETLSERIESKSMSMNDTLEVFIQIARGLDAAHETGIVHRDLKPDNVKISSDGTLKLIDFGIAKYTGDTVEQSADAPTTPMSPVAVTAEGTFMGTPVYMSPEQARGQSIDKRTDIWSFGCCLYEALTGGLPFKGDTIADTVGNILKSDPDWSDIPESAPQEIRSLLRRCLEKDARKRFSSASDMAYVLEEYLERRKTLEQQSKPTPAVAAKTSWTPAIVAVVVVVVGIIATFWMTRGTIPDNQTQPSAARPAITSIAVLPFENQSGDPDQEYFVDGMTGALTSELSKISSIKVIGRASAMHYKDTDKSPREIAEELGVDGLITGTAFQSQYEIRITAELMHASTQTTRWSKAYTNTLENVLKLHSEVALDISAEISATLSEAEKSSYASAKGVNPTAYDLYLQARAIMGFRTEKALDEAIDLFKRVVAIDPNFAPAFAGLADCHGLNASYDYATVEDSRGPVEEYAAKAIALDDTSSEAHLTLAESLRKFTNRCADAEREFRRAIELNPNSAQAYSWYSDLLTFTGRHLEALSAAQRAVELEPASAQYRTGLGNIYYLVRDFDRAATYFDEALAIDPLHPWALEWRARVHMLQGEYVEAVDVVANFRNRDYPVALSKAYAGDVEAARAYLETREEELREENHWRVMEVIEIHAALGDVDTAIEWLDRATSFTPIELRTNPLLTPLQDDPRYWAFIDTLDLPPLPPEHPLYAKEQAYLINKRAEELIAERGLVPKNE